MDDGQRLTVGEAAGRLGVCSRTVRRWAARGRLPGSFRVGGARRGNWIIPFEALARVRRPEDDED